MMTIKNNMASISALRTLSQVQSGVRLPSAATVARCCCPCWQTDADTQSQTATLRRLRSASCLPVGQHRLGQSTLIVSTDTADQITRYISSNILAQAANSMLAQPNQQPHTVLSLLQ